MSKFKIPVDVPAGIEHLSDWADFKLSNFPAKCIIHKELPGCGFTEYCIRSNENMILCSPRKLLLKNKHDQHPNETFLVINKLDKDPGVDKDLNKQTRGSAISSMKDEETLNLDEVKQYNVNFIMNLYQQLEDYKDYCDSHKIPMKILVTYDSYHLVLDTLTKMGIYHSRYFYTVIDEFQSILHDARFKSSTELSFMDHLKISATALFVSATPMMDEYIDDIDEFKYLPYYQMDWGKYDPTRVIKPDLNVSQMYSIGSKTEEIIQSYLSRNFESVVVIRNGQPVRIVSNEAVLYVNSVNQIISIIKRNKLSPDQVNILCADTEENKVKIKNRLGKKFSIGEIPLKGDPHKMFTICTRTVYLGADFYSLCARTFVFSDANSDCLAVDISEDLPQILGRQRLDENPWRHSANFYYKTTADYRKMNKDDFDRKLAKKMEKTESLLRSFDNALDIDKQILAEKYQKDAKISNYKDDYVAVNKVKTFNSNTGEMEVSSKPVVNKLVYINEKRAFRIQQIDYKDRFTVFATLDEKISPSDNSSVTEEVSNFLRVYETLTTIYDKLKYLSESSISKEGIDIILAQIPDSDSVKSYYLALGPQRLYELGYNISRIKKELGIVTFSPDLLLNSIYSNFRIGEKYKLSDLKDKISMVYSSINYAKTPKASEIMEYFKIKEISIYDKKDDGGRRRSKGYELIESYEQKLREDLKYSN